MIKPTCYSIAPKDSSNPMVRCVLEPNHEGTRHKAGSLEWEEDIHKQPTLKVSEIFYSLQGEGARAGEPSIFVRLQGCSAKHACYAQGVVCDTEFESGKEMSLDALLENMLISEFVSMNPQYKIKEIPVQMLKTHCRWIVWTGGEPLDQLTPEIVYEFAKRGYKQAIETSGIKRLDPDIAKFLDHIVVSPKVAEHVLKKHFGHLERVVVGNATTEFVNIHELRYVRHAGQPGIPEPALKAKYYYLSPHSDGDQLNKENLNHCIKLCLENPRWRLSVQVHKVWGVL